MNLVYKYFLLPLSEQRNILVYELEVLTIQEWSSLSGSERASLAFERIKERKLKERFFSLVQDKDIITGG